MNAANGRFWNGDSYEGQSADPQSLHRYIYTSNNPANLTDPSGNFPLGALMCDVILRSWSAYNFYQDSKEALHAALIEKDARKTALYTGLSILDYLGFSGPPIIGGGMSVAMGVATAELRISFVAATRLAAALAARGAASIAFSLSNNASGGSASSGGGSGRGPLTTAEKDLLREEAVDKWFETFGWKPSQWQMEIHHKIPLEWAHLFAKDPNLRSNLCAINILNHKFVSAAWRAFKTGLNGRTPLASEVEIMVTEIEGKYGKWFMEFK